MTMGNSDDENGEICLTENSRLTDASVCTAEEVIP